jgi:hypothetical protein
VRDSLQSVLAASWEFNRDLMQAGPETVLARAAVVRARCGVATPVVRRAEAGVTSTGTTTRQLAELRGALQRVRVALRECGAAFADTGPGSRADTLRQWGPFRGQRIESVISNYEKAARAFAEALWIK